MKNTATCALYVRIPEDLHARLKAAAALDYRKGSLQNIVISALESALPAPAPKGKRK